MANEENNKSAEENGEGNESFVMMSDLVKEQDQLEKETIAIYGASDEKYCSFDNGYLKRQALFSCLTCSPNTVNDLSNAAGICLACSFKCHENHDLIELYTKRNFRCDCGTNKLPDTKCNLTKSKEGKLPINRDNVYNHNFQGLYCTCNRPYPDPENDVGDEGDYIMAQCNICEDWFHYAHLKTKIPENADYYELICEQCLKTHEFLQYYNKYSIKSDEEGEAEDFSTYETDDKLRSTLDKSISDILNIEETEDQPAQKKPKLEDNTLPTTDCVCILPTDKYGYVEGGMFLPSGWRDHLCTCPKCKDMYDEQKLQFLLDPDDSQSLYEENGFKKQDTELQNALENLSAQKRVALVETIHEFHNMAGKLKEFLVPFMGSKKIVTQEDINRFFEKMKSERNASKTQPSTYCR